MEGVKLLTLLADYEDTKMITIRTQNNFEFDEVPVGCVKESLEECGFDFTVTQVSDEDETLLVVINISDDEKETYNYEVRRSAFLVHDKVYGDGKYWTA